MSVRNIFQNKLCEATTYETQYVGKIEDTSSQYVEIMIDCELLFYMSRRNWTNITEQDILYFQLSPRGENVTSLLDSSELCRV